MAGVPQGRKEYGFTSNVRITPGFSEPAIPGKAAREAFHLAGQLLVNTPEAGLINGSANQILHQFCILAGEKLPVQYERR